METSRHVRVVSRDGCDDDFLLPVAPEAPSYHRVAAPLRAAIGRTQHWLLGQQHADGHWCGELEGDTILESEYLLLLAFLGREGTTVAQKAARYLLEHQRPEGGWAIYPGGPVDVSSSVKGYFALKLTGYDPGSEPLERARRAIMAHGGADVVNSFTRFYLALLGQIPYEQCPAVPPEFLLLPQWAPVHLGSVSAWTRTILVPLSVMWAKKPVREPDPRFGIRELFVRAPEDWPALRSPGVRESSGVVTWEKVFRATDRLLKWLERKRIRPLRKKALATAEQWMSEHFDGSDGLGAIFPPMIWSIVALRALGYSDDHPHLRNCHQRLDGLLIEEDNTIRLQPCKSPVWDTAITVRALQESGLNAEHDAVSQAVDWLAEQEIRTPGDWASKVKAEPAGWCFEYANRFFPDLDDTAMTLMALRGQFDQALANDDSLPPALRLVSQSTQRDGQSSRHRVAALDRVAGACQRGLQWMLAMQNKDGGWGAFDRDNDREFLCHVPFADHNAMIDPSTPDLTARVLESLAHLGQRQGEAKIDRAVAFLRSTQEADGSWFGRWGVNYIYGTWQAIVGLSSVNVPQDDPAIVAGANWLLAYQQPCGGWGESPDSYADPQLRGQGPVTASQTAWAVLGLIAAGMHEHPATARGVQHLLTTQQADGTWHETEFTGTGFPQVFYLKYHMYRIYFPLMALSRWAKAMGQHSSTIDETRDILPVSVGHRLRSTAKL